MNLEFQDSTVFGGVPSHHDKGDEVKQKPLYLNDDDDDSQVTFYRRKKEKEEKHKEDERKKQEEIQRQLNELDEKGKKNDKEALGKKQFTYDSKGNLIFVKSFRADLLPNPLLNPPYKVKEAKGYKSRGYSQNETPLETTRATTDAYGRKNKVSLVGQLETPFILEEINPMGSNFNEAEPNQGVTIMEQGKVKYGSQNMSRRTQGQMSLDEYKSSNNRMLVNENLQERSQQKVSQEQEFRISMSKIVPQATAMNQTQTFYMTLNASKQTLDISNFNQPHSQLNTIRVSDKLIPKQKEIMSELVTERTVRINENSLEQSSFVDPFKAKKFDFNRNLSQTQQDFAKIGLKSTRSIIVQQKIENINSVRLQPLTQRGAQSSTDISHDAALENLRSKNRQILTDHFWGMNPGDRTSIPKQIEKKPNFSNLKKSSSQMILARKKKERPFIEQIRKKQHLPPPPLGKTLGHGGFTYQLPQQISFKPSQLNIL